MPPDVMTYRRTITSLESNLLVTFIEPTGGPIEVVTAEIIGLAI